MMFETMTLCMKYFCSVITNLNLHVEYLITRSIYTRCFYVPVVIVWQKKIDKLLLIHVLHKINDMFRYWYFFVSLFFTKAKTGIPCLSVGDRFGFRRLCSVNPVLPRPIIK